MRILTDATGAVIWKQNGLNLVGAKSLPVSLASAIASAQAAGVSGDPETWLSWTTDDAPLARAIEAAPIERLDAALGGGAITAVEVVAEAEPPSLYIHFSLTAPGTGPTGVPSVASGETATFTAEIHTGEDPASDIFPYTGAIRAPYCKNGAYHGELRMVFAAGVCTYVFEPQAHHHGTLTIDESLFGTLSGYKIKVIGDAVLIVDEKSAA